jgi:hypothetical protein
MEKRLVIDWEPFIIVPGPQSDETPFEEYSHIFSIQLQEKAVKILFAAVILLWRD